MRRDRHSIRNELMATTIGGHCNVIEIILLPYLGLGKVTNATEPFNTISHFHDVQSVIWCGWMWRPVGVGQMEMDGCWATVQYDPHMILTCIPIPHGPASAWKCSEYLKENRPTTPITTKPRKSLSSVKTRRRLPWDVIDTLEDRRNIEQLFHELDGYVTIPPPSAIATAVPTSIVATDVSLTSGVIIHVDEKSKESITMDIMSIIPSHNKSDNKDVDNNNDVNDQNKWRGNGHGRVAGMPNIPTRHISSSVHNSMILPLTRSFVDTDCSYYPRCRIYYQLLSWQIVHE
jgi:hypothetical protein